jgi:hypothetical protein
MAVSTLPTKQRADLTFKQNRLHGRHGWLRLTPAYSIKVVEEVLDQHPSARSVVDPFSGTATTPLCAAMRGIDAVSLDINPFLVWLGNTKLSSFDSGLLAEANEAIVSAVDGVGQGKFDPCEPPPISNIERWWDPRSLDYLCRLMTMVRTIDVPYQIRDLLKIAFCRTMIAVSNAAFNHQSMSFKAPKGAKIQDSLFPSSSVLDLRFRQDLEEVFEGATETPVGAASVQFIDARQIGSGALNRKFDLLVTSPPYPNRMSYIRELRPYMYWLGYLSEAREAGELDWQAIGGTWGIATSRLSDWSPSNDGYLPESLSQLLDRVRNSDAKSGAILANYIGKYFEDMWLHLRGLPTVMNPGAEVHYVVGNSKFYDVLFPVELIYEDMMLKAGLKKVDVRPIRKRNSKKELIEYDVVGVV